MNVGKIGLAMVIAIAMQASISFFSRSRIKESYFFGGIVISLTRSVSFRNNFLTVLPSN
jgi:hypothetical protein